MTKGLQVESAASSHAWSVVARGEIDINTAVQLEEVLDDVIANGARLIALDLQEVDFIDSSGLRVIVAVSEKLRAADGRLFVAGASPTVVQVLEITGLIEKLKGPDSGPA